MRQRVKMLKIYYEDNHIIVCYKEKGILSQADSSDKLDMLTIIKDYIKEKYNKPGNVYLGLVHRLDINTSGIMVFAKTSKAAKRLSESIQKHRFIKKYKATVEGLLDNNDYLLLKNYITKNEEQKKSYITNTGQEAILEFKALKSYKLNNTLVTDIEINLKTGRFHQIRCQMANIGHPLYGDIKYGSKNKANEMPLEAYHLSFPHPITNEILVFENKE